MSLKMGYMIEHEGATHSKFPAKTFEDIKRILKSLYAGHVSVVRLRDNFEVYCGPVDKARWKFGL